MQFSHGLLHPLAILDCLKHLRGLFFGSYIFSAGDLDFAFVGSRSPSSMDVRRCQTPAMVEMEVMMHAVSYNLMRTLIQEAAIRHQADLTRITFKEMRIQQRGLAVAVVAGERHGAG